MNNKEFIFKGDFTIDSKELFWKAIQLAFDTNKATHYSEDDDGFTFYWHGDKDTIKLPIPLGAKPSADLAYEWLVNQPEEKRKEPFGGDGSEGLGYKVYIRHPHRLTYEICTIQPIWAWYGK